MASNAAPVTRASGGEGGGKKIMGVNRTTFFVVGGAALGLGLLYFYLQSKKQTPSTGQGQGTTPGSPTGLSRENLVIWSNNHGRHHGKGKAA